MNPFTRVIAALSLSDQSQGECNGYLYFALKLSATAFDTESDTAVLIDPFREVIRRWTAAGLMSGFAGAEYRKILEPRIR